MFNHRHLLKAVSVKTEAKELSDKRGILQVDVY